MKDLPEEIYIAIKIDPSIIDWFRVLTIYYFNDYQLNEFFESINNYTDSTETSATYCIFKYQKTSIDFIRQHLSDINRYYWDSISRNLNTSEEVFIEFENKINWSYLSSYRKMDISFIKRFSHKIKFENVIYNSSVSQDVKDYCRIFL